MSTDRPATTDQQPAVYGATQPARLVITETVAASRTQGDGPWTTAEAILAALDREGYTVAPRASEAVRGDGSPTPAEEAAQGREDGSAAESGPPVYLVETLGGRWGPEFDDLADARIYAEYCRETYGETRIVRVTREVIQ